MKLSRLVILLVLAAVITFGVVLVAVSVSRPASPGTQRLPYLFRVSDTPGVDVGRDILRLGAVLPGGGSWRTITVQDTLSSSVGNGSIKRVHFQVVGDGSAWVTISPSEVDLPAVINVSLHVPASAPNGVYKGELLVVPVKVQNATY